MTHCTKSIKHKLKYKSQNEQKSISRSVKVRQRERQRHRFRLRKRHRLRERREKGTEIDRDRPTGRQNDALIELSQKRMNTYLGSNACLAPRPYCGNTVEGLQERDSAGLFFTSAFSLVEAIPTLSY